MKLNTKNGLVIECIPMKALSNGYLLVFTQDRLTVAKINTAVDCNEVDTFDIIHMYGEYL